MVPDYQSLMLPLLRHIAIAEGPTSVRKHVEPIATELGLSEADRSERLPSGQDNLLTNRLQWARTYLVKAGLLEAPKRGLVEITERGRSLLADRPARIDNATLSRFPEYLDWIEVGRTKPKGKVVLRLGDATGDEIGSGDATASVPIETPEERIGVALHEIDEALKAEVLNRVRQLSPTEFEGLILKLLLAMGYGQGLEEMAEAIGGTGDGGMDGVIHQDPLGLDRVYIQAKRYREGNNVSSPDIRNFIGALNIHRANKGVFVTASQFTADAKQAARGSTVQVVLIDGNALADMMVRFKVGVLVRNTFELKEIDEGFFLA